MKFEQRSVENDLRAQIAEQQREIIRLKIIDEEKEKKFQELHEKLDIHIETVQVQLEEAKNELIEEAKKKGNEQNEDLSQTEIVTLFKNCIIVPDSNSFHTHADVQPFLKALNAGVDNLRFRVNFMSPLKKERGWNIDQHFYHGTDEDGAPCFFPKIIHVNNKKLITFGDYALRFCIIIGEKHIFPIIIFQLFSPQDAIFKISACSEGEGYLSTQKSTEESKHNNRKIYSKYRIQLTFPQSHDFYKGESMSITYSISREN